MTRRIKRHRKLKAVDRNATDYCSRLLECYCIKFHVLIRLYLSTDTVISLYRRRFYAWCAKNSSLYREDRYIGVLFHTFYCNFCQDIAYLSLYQGSLYRGSTVCMEYQNCKVSQKDSLLLLRLLQTFRGVFRRIIRMHVAYVITIEKSISPSS